MSALPSTEAASVELADLRVRVAELEAELRQSNSCSAAGNDELLAAIVEGSNDAIISKTLDGIVTSWSRAAEATFGYTAAEMIGQSISRLIPPERPDDLAHILGRIRLGERVEHYETVRQHKDGRILSVSLTVSPIRDRAGRIVGASKIARDITKERQLVTALRDSEERFRKVFAHAPVGMVLTNPEGQFLQVNQAYCDIVGYSPEELRNKEFFSLNDPVDGTVNQELYSQLLAGLIPGFVIEKRYLRKDGHTVWVRASATMLREEGRPAQIVGIVEDISDRHRAEEEVLQLNATLEARVEARTRELAEVNSELEAFSYSVSHDLRAPLRAIDGFGHRLLERYSGRVLDDTAVNYVERMTRASERMGQLIEDLLNFSRLGRAALTRRPLPLSAIAAEIVAELRSREPERKISVFIQQELNAEGDPRLVRIVLENLLGNAWKYTGRKEDVKVEFGALRQKGEVVYYVRDNGAGFDIAHAGHLFAPFQRLHRASEFEGTGIGLATVQRIIHRHSGRIWAEAEKDKGAVFFFTLPPAPERTSR